MKRIGILLLMLCGVASGQYAVVIAGVTPPESNPPTPNPATFSVAPAAVSAEAITMTATTGTDENPIYYYFAETSGGTGGSDSGWQLGQSYTDSLLASDTVYTYTVQTKDALDNTGTASGGESATTPATGDVYYVATDGDNGADGAIRTPWLTIDYGDSRLSAGDTLYVRGGRYSEYVIPQSSGTVGNPTTISAYQSEEVIIDRTVAVTGFVQCLSDDPNLTVGGVTNSNYASIYRAKFLTSALPTDIYDTMFFEDDVLLILCSEPNQVFGHRKDTFLYTALEAEAYGVRDRVIDSDLTQAADYWNGAILAVHVTNYANRQDHKAITDFTASPGTLILESDLGVYVDDTISAGDSYRIVNHPHIINGSGEFYLIEDAGDAAYTWVYLWPNDTANLASNIRMTPKSSNSSLSFFEDSYYDINGITSFGSPTYGFRMQDCNNINLTNCSVIYNSNITAIYMYGDVESVVISDCAVYRGRGTGIFGYTVDGLAIRNSTVTDQSMYFVSTSNVEISHNTIQGKLGTHSNGIAIYTGSSDFLVAHNKILLLDSPVSNAVTFNTPTDLYFFGNLIVTDWSLSVTPWSAITDDWHWIHNTVYSTNSETRALYFFYGTPSFFVKNNIIDGPYTYNGQPGSPNRDYNLWTMDGGNTGTGSWSLSTNEILDTNYADVFVDYASADFNIPSDSQAAEAGTATLTLPTVQWPAYDFSVDLNGNAWASPPSMGAFEVIVAE